ncbi:MAG TPA: plastocyanin/azurin family copper-binding protein, partial [Candidatus Acidoferrales bacterium]
MRRNLVSVLFGLALAAGLRASAPDAGAQQTWRVQVGAESHAQARRVGAFLPNEIWIYAGDSIKFTFSLKGEAHTVTLLQDGQERPLFSGPMANAAAHIVKLPTPGNYKLVCPAHADMYGVVHVMQHTDSTAAFYAASLPYDQFDYDHQAAEEMNDLFAGRDEPSEEVRDFPPSENVVLLTGEIVVDAEGGQYLAIVHLLPGTIRIHAGEKVEWINTDPMEPHTVTFGPQQVNPQTAVTATLGPDGALQATINSPMDSVSSGFLAADQARAFLPQSAPGGARLRIKFTKPGTYHYVCAPTDGMVGTVIV